MIHNLGINEEEKSMGQPANRGVSGK